MIRLKFRLKDSKKWLSDRNGNGESIWLEYGSNGFIYVVKERSTNSKLAKCNKILLQCPIAV